MMSQASPFGPGSIPVDGEIVAIIKTMEEKFLKYKKVTRDGRTAAIDGPDLYDLIQLDKRADRTVREPISWRACQLPRTASHEP